MVASVTLVQLGAANSLKHGADVKGTFLPLFKLRLTKRSCPKTSLGRVHSLLAQPKQLALSRRGMFAKLVSALGGSLEVEVWWYCLLDVHRLEVRAQSISSVTDVLQDKESESSTAPPGDKTASSRCYGPALLCLSSTIR